MKIARSRPLALAPALVVLRQHKARMIISSLFSFLLHSWNGDGDGAEEEENCDGGSNAVHHDRVGEESRCDDDHRVLAEGDEEVGKAEEAEEDAGCSEKAVGDLEPPLRAFLVLLLLSPWVRVRNIHLVSELKSRKSSNWFHSPHKQS